MPPLLTHDAKKQPVPAVPAPAQGDREITHTFATSFTNGYTEYVDNDIDVDDVDDDEEGASDYFLLLRHSDAHISMSFSASVKDKPFYC